MNRGLQKEVSTLTALTALALWAGRKRSAAATLGIAAGILRLWPSKKKGFRDQVVVITGGSRGLGLALAEGFLAEGARVAILARDRGELLRAQNKLRPLARRRVLAVRCDVTDSADLAGAIARIQRTFGGIDILVNNAGAIALGPFETVRREDFQALIDINLHAVVEATQAVLPIFRERGSGRIVNICSFGGKVAVPHMSTYTAGKFALAGLSQAITAELAAENIQVTTVYPGVMRVGSPIQASIKGDQENEYAWFAMGAFVPGVAVSAQTAVKRILNGVKYGDAEVIFPITAKAAAIAQNAFPEISAAMRGFAAQFFPKGDSERRETGAQNRHSLRRRRWYRPFDAAAQKIERQWNQREKFDADFNLGT